MFEFQNAPGYSKQHLVFDEVAAVAIAGSRVQCAIIFKRKSNFIYDYNHSVTFSKMLTLENLAELLDKKPCARRVRARKRISHRRKENSISIRVPPSWGSSTPPLTRGIAKVSASLVEAAVARRENLW